MASAGSGDETVKAIDVSFGEWGNEICHETKLAPTTSIEPFIAGTRAGRDVAEVRKGGTHGTGWGAESVSVHEAAAGNPPGQKRCREVLFMASQRGTSPGIQDVSTHFEAKLGFSV